MNKKSLFFWFVAFVCAALIFTGCPQEPDDDDTVTPVTASFTDVTVSGEKGVELTGVDVTLTITGDKIGEAITANDDLLAWITGAKPAWLTAKAKESVAAGAASVVITIGGTPAAASSEVLGLNIPAAALAGGADITATGKITLAVTYPAAEAAGDLAATLGATNAEVDSTDPTKVTLKANVSLDDDETLAIPAGVTLVVPADKTVTVSSGATLDVDGIVSVAGTVTGAGTISGAGSITVTGTGTAPGIAYGLSTTNNMNPSGLSYASATKNLATGLTTVKLGGTVEAGVSQVKDAIWGADPGENAPDGNWSWAVITGILPAGLEANSGIEIKQTNASLLYYRGIELGDVSSESSLPNEAPTITDGDGSPGCIFFVGDTAYKWAKYGTGRNPKDTEDDGFGVLLWSGADPKTATLEITPKNGTLYTVIVDWSCVTIND